MQAPPGFASPPPLWGDPDHVRALFVGSGVQLSFVRSRLDFVHASPAAFVDFMAERYGPLLKAREALTPSGRWDALRAELVELATLADGDGEDGFRAASEYLVAIGEKRV